MAAVSQRTPSKLVSIVYRSAQAASHSSLMLAICCTAPRSTASHWASANVLSHLVASLPSNAKLALEAPWLEDAKVVAPRSESFTDAQVSGTDGGCGAEGGGGAEGGVEGDAGGREYRPLHRKPTSNVAAPEAPGMRSSASTPVPTITMAAYESWKAIELECCSPSAARAGLAGASEFDASSTAASSTISPAVDAFWARKVASAVASLWLR